MSESDIVDIIFMPGFSTKNIVTNISGRGVGLDVVKSNMVGLKGHISVESRLGVGTTFTLRVPLTLSSERGLFVQCGDQKLVLPTNYIERVMLSRFDDIVSVSGGQAIIIDNHTIPCCRLANVLRLPLYNTSDNEFPTIIVSNSNYSIAFFVDKILGEREMIVKSFQPPMNNIKYVSGATLLEHNELAMVLNVDDLIMSALNTKQKVLVQEVKVEKQQDEKLHILVVDDSITTRTLEKNVLENKNYQVTTAVNGQEAWDLLQKQRFALMITDINMPIMDGFTLTERVKSDDRLRELPIIIVTSLGSDAEKSRGVEVGADAYIVKSEFESSALLDVVEQLVQS
jgi:chemotaxis protein histidine kinase CheA